MSCVDSPSSPGRIDLLGFGTQRQLADDVGADLEALRHVPLAADLLVGQDLDVEQAVRLEAGPVVVHLGERQAPALQPGLELLALAAAAAEEDGQPDRARRLDLAAVARVDEIDPPHAPVLRADVEGYPLGHARSPAVLIL